MIDLPRQTRNHSIDEQEPLPDLSAMPDPRGLQANSLQADTSLDHLLAPGRDMLVNEPQPLPGVLPPSDAKQQADDFTEFYRSLPFGLRAGIAEQGGLPALATHFMQQRQTAAAKLQQAEEQKRQHDIGLLEKAMTNPRAQLMLEQLGESQGYSMAPQARSLAKAMKEGDYASFDAYKEVIPQDVQQRFVQGQLPHHELVAWLDHAREATKVNAKEKAKALLVQRAMNKKAEERTPHENQLVEEHQTALELKNAEIDLKKAQASKAKAEAEKGPNPDRTTIGRLHETLAGGLSWEQGTDATRRKTMDEYARLYPEGRTNVMLGTPAKAEERSNLVDRKAFMEKDQIKQPPPGTTAGGTRSGDYVEMTDKQREDWSGIVNSGATLKTLFDMVDPLITATTPAQALKQYGKLSLGAVAKTNPAAATYLADSEAFSSRMARVFGSEVGVLTQGDVNRWKNALPSFGDTKEVLAKKREVFFSIYKQTREMYKKKIGGEDWTEDYVKLSRGPLADAQKLGIHSKTTDEQFDILMGKPK